MTVRLLFTTKGIYHSRYLELSRLDNKRIGKWALHTMKKKELRVI